MRGPILAAALAVGGVACGTDPVEAPGPAGPTDAGDRQEALSAGATEAAGRAEARPDGADGAAEPGEARSAESDGLRASAADGPADGEEAATPRAPRAPQIVPPAEPAAPTVWPAVGAVPRPGHGVGQTAHPARRPAPEGFVDLAAVVPHVRIDARYHTADNFTGAPLPGYGAPGAWLLQPAAEALAAAAADLAEDGLALRVYDAYRPARASRAMVAWCRRTGRTDLLDGYIAATSNHNRGNTLDLTLVDRTTGEPLDMGVPWDTLDARAHTTNAEGEVLANRLRLRQALTAHGWRNYSKEWWHYRFPMDPRPPRRDVPYGCFEADDGAWSPPEGFDEPAFTPPAAWPSDPPCARPPSHGAPGDGAPADGAP